MSKREDIIDPAAAEKVRYGLVYTERCGWIDLGHASPQGEHGATAFWTRLKNTQTDGDAGQRPRDSAQGGRPSISGRASSVAYSQMMGNRMVKVGIQKRYEIQPGLTEDELRGVALAIFQDVSLRFEGLQASWVFSWKTDSGFSAEDLVSDLISFYRAVLPGKSYVALCEPVSKDEALKIWDEFGAVGSMKNRSFDPILFARDEKTGRRKQQVGKLPPFLDSIKPIAPGKLYRVLP